MPCFSDLTGKCDIYFACNSKTDLVLTFFGVHGNILGQGTEAVRCAQFVSSASSLVHYESSIYGKALHTIICRVKCGQAAV